ncbi:MAG: GNAT family N-acetyltransferase [Chloroflexi bacterium]|nr:GNAT family N-acetyltransferase [Chloroflexota bacterium]
MPARQLCMAICAVHVHGLAGVVLPDGYELRCYRPSDTDSLTATLRASGFGDWDAARVLAYLDDPDRRAGSAVVAFDGRVVASTFASRMSSDRVSPLTGKPGEPQREGVLDYVATHPDHRGRGLGRATCTAVSHYLVEQGCEMVSLLTDDWRLPAIHLYLSLGYEPVMNRADMPGRWARVRTVLERLGRAHA